MLDPALWMPRFSVIYNTDDRSAFNLLWQHQSRLTRIDITTTTTLKDTWNKGGDLDRLSEGRKVGQTRYIPWGSSYQVWGDDDFYPYTLRWKPVPWFPDGAKIQFWEYTGDISRPDLLRYLQLDSSNPNAEFIIQLETLKDLIMLLNPGSGNATTSSLTSQFLQTDAISRVMVAANADRNGGLIYNKGSKALWVGFGVTAEKSSPNKVLPGGVLDIPSGFIGVINGIFEAADAAVTAKAQIVEMIGA
jgi:hypothetical protein